jgi:hypothetical protein
LTQYYVAALAHYIFIDSSCSEAHSSIYSSMDKLVINGRNYNQEIDFPDLSLSLDWPDRTMGLGPDRTGLILVWSGPKVKDRTVKQSLFLVWTRLKLL